MKTVIRKNVFETNSSSTHSLSIKGRAKSNCVSKGASFELRSPLAKAVQMIGLIDNAESVYLSSGYWIDEDVSAVKVKQKIISKIKELYPEKIADKKANEFSAIEINNLLDEIDDSAIFGRFGTKASEFFSDGDYMLENFFIIDRDQRKCLLKFREYIIEEYSNKVGKSKEEGLRELEFEAFANIELKEILQDEEHAEEKLRKNMKLNYKFKREFDSSSERNIVKFAKQFLIKDFEEFKEYRKGKFSCEIYFCNGCLNDCYCGFENMFEIIKVLGLDEFDDELLRKKAKWLVGNSSRIVAKEEYGGVMLEETGEIY